MSDSCTSHCLSSTHFQSTYSYTYAINPPVSSSLLPPIPHPSSHRYWTSLETFPAFEAVPYYLSGDGTASTALPLDSAPPSTTYKFDPTDPIPTLGGNNLPASIGGSIPCGPLDQQSIDGRTDMVVFDAPKAGPEEIVMTGPVSAELFVSSDAVDTDFMVRVSDVYNDEEGTVRLLQVSTDISCMPFSRWLWLGHDW